MDNASLQQYLNEVRIFQRVLNRLEDVDERFKITIERGGLQFRVRLESENERYWLLSTPARGFDFRIEKDNNEVFVRQGTVPELADIVNDLK